MMRSSIRAIVVTSALALGESGLRADPPAGDVLAVLEPAPGPATDVPELAVLDAFVGEWVGEFGGNELDNTVRTRAFWVLDGRYVLSAARTRGKANGREGKNLILWTYDTQKKAYRRWFFFDGGGGFEESGQWDPDAKTLRFQSFDPNSGTSTNSEIKILDNDAKEWTMVLQGKEGKPINVRGTNRRTR